jgi:hypothetical protein
MPSGRSEAAAATGAEAAEAAAAEAAAAPGSQQRVMLPLRPGWHQDCV